MLFNVHIIFHHSLMFFFTDWRKRISMSFYSRYWLTNWCYFILNDWKKKISNWNLFCWGSCLCFNSEVQTKFYLEILVDELEHILHNTKLESVLIDWRNWINRFLTIEKSYLNLVSFLYWTILRKGFRTFIKSSSFLFISLINLFFIL